MSATTIDFGRTRDQAVVTLSNTGGRPVDWSTSTGPLAFRAVASPFSFAPTSGSLAAGASIEIVVTIDRDWPTEGPVPSQRVTFAAAGTTASVDLLGEIGRAPVLRPVQVPPARACVSGVANGLFWQVAIADETPPITARVEVVTPGGRVLADEMVRNGDWYGALVPDGDGDGLPDAGTHTWTVRAVDALGNLGTLQGTVDLGAC